MRDSERGWFSLVLNRKGEADFKVQKQDREVASLRDTQQEGAGGEEVSGRRNAAGGSTADWGGEEPGSR